MPCTGSLEPRDDLALTTMTSSTKPARRRWLIAIGVLGLLAALAVRVVVGFGRWLVVSDPLEPARAIVLLRGEVPYRAEETARIYRQGLAPEVWMAPDLRNLEMDRLGITYTPEEVYDEAVLTKLGVPKSAIRLMPNATENTEQEELGVLQELRRVGGDRVILVTSKYHTRRVRLVWHNLAGNSPRAIVRGASDQPFDADHWWRNADDVKVVGHEFFGLLNTWAGYPIRQRQTD